MGQSVDVVVSELHSAAARLEDAAQRLKDGLSSVDDETARLLGADWKGRAASAYAPAWDTWHDGAEQVATGLQRMSELLTIAGKEYAKTDESASGAVDSTMQGSGGSAGGGSGTSGGASGGAEQTTAGQISGGAGSGAGQASGSAAGMRQAMAAAMQLGQVAGQPLSQVGQVAPGLAQAMTGLAQQVTELATAAAEQAGEASSTDGDETQQAETPDGSAAGPGNSTGIAPADSAPTGRADGPRAAERPGE